MFGSCYVLHYLVSFSYTVLPTKCDSDVMFVYNRLVNMNVYTPFGLTRIQISLVY